VTAHESKQRDRAAMEGSGSAAHLWRRHVGGRQDPRHGGPMIGRARRGSTCSRRWPTS